MGYYSIDVIVQITDSLLLTWSVIFLILFSEVVLVATFSKTVAFQLQGRRFDSLLRHVLILT